MTILHNGPTKKKKHQLSESLAMLDATIQADRPDPNGSTAHIAIALGGTGIRAAERIRDTFEEDGRPFPLGLVGIDTDCQDAPWLDHSLWLQLTAADLECLFGSPEMYSPEVQKILTLHGSLFDAQDTNSGSRTTRAVSQVAVAFREEEILEAIRGQLIRLINVGGFTSFQPIFLGSTGGGAGSAIAILLTMLLYQPEFRQRLLRNIQAEMRRPNIFGALPYAYANANSPIHADKILANSYAFCLEAVELQRRQLLDFVFLLGFDNGQGTVINNDAEIANQLASTVYAYIHSYPLIHSREVDMTIHANNARYKGLDRFEHRYLSFLINDDELIEEGDNP